MAISNNVDTFIVRAPEALPGVNFTKPVLQIVLIFTVLLPQKIINQRFTSIPNGNISDGSKLNAFADYKLNVAQIRGLEIKKLGIIVGKEENAGELHFLLLPSSEGLVFRVIKT